MYLLLERALGSTPLCPKVSLNNDNGTLDKQPNKEHYCNNTANSTLTFAVPAKTISQTG